MKLAINIDHVATLREARGEIEPDPVTAAGICELAGAEGIVCHLREDRRHINDRDLRLLKETVQSKLDLEMAATDEMLKIAIETLPEIVTLVPEKRSELTTEGGLNLTAGKEMYKDYIKELKSKDILVSLFIDPDPANVDLAVGLSADIIEIHTGKYANMRTEKDILTELSKISVISTMAAEQGLIVTAGHGLNYRNIMPIVNIPEIQEVSIGHSVISRAVFTGLENAVKEMLKLVRNKNY
ncbi:MAG TPA: pyridoxine 5'-phosphate synthase [Ignavibacteria bacterium]|nr:pyridoxine 5'-phosphate synthase [Bacteroidota bacterium]HRI85058.1 pyridoxine 5'-phosphate synthase [Ignavibacteria bacterium]HRJ99747.1 pyridoxine 5'-phosphate synthase [Ignavibacteria bacterium]